MIEEQTLYWYGGECPARKDIENSLTNWVDDNVRAAVKECLSGVTAQLHTDLSISVVQWDNVGEKVGEKVFSLPELVNDIVTDHGDADLPVVLPLLEGLADKVRQELADRSSGIKRSYP